MEKENSPRVSRRDERRAKRPSIIDPNQLYGIDEAAAARDKSRAGIYLEIAAGLIGVVKDGARTKVLGAELIRRNHEIASGGA